QTQRLLDAYDGKEPYEGLPKFMDAMVPAAVLKIAPTDRDHINDTFAFCSATGVNKTRVGKSIADGCFQTLRSLCDVQQLDSNSLLRRCVTNLRDLAADCELYRAER